MKNKKDVYIDIKTVSNSNKAAIFQLRAISFDFVTEGQETDILPLSYFQSSIDLCSSMFYANGKVDKRLIKESNFITKEHGSVINYKDKKLLSDSDTPIRIGGIQPVNVCWVLKEFKNYIEEQQPIENFWFENLEFSNAVLNNAYKNALGDKILPWWPYKFKDLKTFCYLVEQSGLSANLDIIRNASHLRQDSLVEKAAILRSTLIKLKDLVPF